MNSQLGIGPLSSEIIEAIFRYSHYFRKELMIIASKNQIDYNGGYVNNWTTKEFMGFIEEMRLKYPNSDIKICRDHCGPGFNGIFDLEDTYRTIKTDIENGFDLIHIDFCNFKGLEEEKLEESKKAIEYAQSLNPRILIEVGTDENVGTNFGMMNLEEIEREIDFFTSFCRPEFYVVQTGSLVKEMNQAGNFNKEFLKKISSLIQSKGLKLKEHNADYLSKEDIDLRKDIVDAMNIAPQLGVIQTALILKKCLIYGIKFDDFFEEVYQGKRWKKWLNSNTEENKLLCFLIAGHYHFSSDRYKRIMNQLKEREDIEEEIIKSMMDLIDHYAR